MNHSIHSADRSHPPEDRGCRTGRWHRGRGFRYLGAIRFGFHPDRPCREGGQAGGCHQLGPVDGPLNDNHLIGIKTAARWAAFLLARGL